MANPHMFSAEQRERLRRGDTVTISGDVYRLCLSCQRIVKMNKFLFGSVHICGEGD